MKNDRPLQPRQLAALQLLISGTPASYVAARLDVSPMTIYRWRQLPEFEARLNAITESGLEEVAEKMNAAALTAVENIQSMLCDMSLPTATQIKLCLGVLNAMPAMNAALEKGLIHRAGEFDSQTRWIGPGQHGGHTYDSGGKSCNADMESSIPV